MRRRSAERQRLRTADEGDREPLPAPRPERAENPQTARILGLQGSAGNRAVAQLLTSSEGPDGAATLQRQPAEKGSGAKPANEGETANSQVMSIPDMKLEMPLLSFHKNVDRPQQPKSEAGEVHVTLELKDFDPRLAKAVADGRHFETITVKIGEKATFTLSDVVFSSLQTGSDVVAMSLDFAKMEFHHIQED